MASVASMEILLRCHGVCFEYVKMNGDPRRSIPHHGASANYAAGSSWRSVFFLNASGSAHEQLRLCGDGTSVYSVIRQTGEARDRTCDPCFTRRVT